MKLLASDYDGTLKYLDHVTQQDLDAIQKWKDSGNLFVMDTGRSMESILEEVRKYHIPADYFITNNGGMLFDKDGNELFSSYLVPLMSHDIMYIAKSIPGVVSYVVNDGFHRHRIIVNDQLEEKRYPGLMPDISEQELLEMGKYAQIVISYETQEEASAIARKLNDRFSSQISAYANKYVVDVVPKGISKAHGLHFLKDYLHIKETDIYAIGDAENDIPLMEFADQGCCMTSGKKELHAHAKYVCDNISDYISLII